MLHIIKVSSRRICNIYSSTKTVNVADVILLLIMYSACIFVIERGDFVLSTPRK